jgi:hypothetical protein
MKQHRHILMRKACSVSPLTGREENCLDAAAEPNFMKTNIISLPTPVTTEPSVSEPAVIDESDLSQDRYNAIRDTIHYLLADCRDSDGQWLGAIQAVVDAATHESYMAFTPDTAPHFIAEAVTSSVNEQEEQLGIQSSNDRLDVCAVNEHGRPMHEMVAENALGRPLLPTETVVAVNGNLLDCRRENLRVINND